MWVRCCSTSRAAVSLRCGGARATAATAVQRQQCSAHTGAWQHPTCIPDGASMLWWCRSGAVVAEAEKLWSVLRRVNLPILDGIQISMAPISCNNHRPSAREVTQDMYHYVLYNHGAGMVVGSVRKVRLSTGQRRGFCKFSESFCKGQRRNALTVESEATKACVWRKECNGTLVAPVCSGTRARAVSCVFSLCAKTWHSLV